MNRAMVSGAFLNKWLAPLCAVCMCAWLALGGPAAAQQSGGASRPLRVFLPKDFEAYAPVNARAALDRLPGLEIVDGGDQRGLGSGGNVLINGERAGGKSNTALDQLERLPAGAVLRIEVYAAGTDAFDAGGSSQVINVVINQQDGQISGTYGGRMLYRPRFGTFHGDILSSATWTKGKLTIDLAFERDANKVPSFSIETLTPRRASTPDVSRDENRLFRSRAYRFTGGLTWKRASGEVFRLSSTGEFYDESVSENNADFQNVTGVFEESDLFFRGEGAIAEVTAEYEKRLSDDFQLKMTALQSIDIFQGATSIALNDSAGGSFVSQIATNFDTRESILRSRFVWQVAPRHILTTQLEGAYNKLDASLFFRDGTAFVNEVRLDENLSSLTTVQEYRGDAFLEHQWTLSKKWVLTSRLAGELSNLRVTGNSSNSRTLIFPKPQVNLAYQISKQHRLEFAVERVIGQLDFGDFAADVSLADGEERGSTGALRPQREWRNGITWEMQLPRGSGRTSLVLFYDALQDVIETIPISADPLEGIDAIGNIGSGSRLGIEAEFSLRLGPLGLPDILLEGNVRALKTRITDPLTGEQRRLGGEERLNYDFNYRHDITKWKLSYGANIDFGGRERNFEINQLIESRNEPGVGIFIETQAIKGATLRFRVFDLLVRNRARSRTIFDPNRLADPNPIIESRNRERGRGFFLSYEAVY